MTVTATDLRCPGGFWNIIHTCSIFVISCSNSSISHVTHLEIPALASLLYSLPLLTDNSVATIYGTCKRANIVQLKFVAPLKNLCVVSIIRLQRLQSMFFHITVLVCSALLLTVQVSSDQLQIVRTGESTFEQWLGNMTRWPNVQGMIVVNLYAL